MNLYMRNTLLLGGSALALTLPGFAAQAQQAPAAAAPSAAGQAGALEEVVVTARRTAEKLQSTPVAVTALTTKALDRAQVANVEDVQRTTPNLSVSTGAPAAGSFARISIRGESNQQSGNANDPAVGIYVDGAYVARPAGSLLDLADVRQVEVLRGPQGTLFGRNTTGGAVNIVTNDPIGRYQGLAQIQLGNYNERVFTGVLNMPITDDLAARLVYKHSEHAGYAHDTTTNTPLADTDDDFFRFKVRYAPTGKNWDFTLSGDYDRNKDNGQDTVLIGYNPQSVEAVLLGVNLNPYIQNSSNFYTAYGATSPGMRRGDWLHDSLTQFGVTGQVNVDLGWAKFKSITGYRDLRTEGFIDLDASPANLLASMSLYADRSVSQEFQLSGQEGPLSWIGGVYYFHEQGAEISYFQAFGLLGLPIGENYGNTSADSYAVYAQANYKLTSKLRLTGGVRYTYDERDVVLHNTSVQSVPATCNLTVLDPGSVCSETEKANFSYPAYTVDLDYQAAPNLFLYAKTSGAYMAGGFNLRVGAVPAFKPEGARDVELGLKSDWFEHRLRLNAAVFHTWQSQVQRNVAKILPSGASTEYVINAGSAQISGAEFEATAAPWKGMELSANLGLLDGHYDKGTFTEQQQNGAAVDTVDQSNDPFLQLPKVSYGVAGTQTVPFDLGDLVLHLDYSFIDKQQFFFDTPDAAYSAAVKAEYAQANALGLVKGYGLLNGKVSFTFREPNIEVAIYGRNLTGEKYLTRSFADVYSSLGAAIAWAGPPETYGVSLTYRFGM